jgi:hypothetical protein
MNNINIITPTIEAKCTDSFEIQRSTKQENIAFKITSILVNNTGKS